MHIITDRQDTGRHRRCDERSPNCFCAKLAIKAKAHAETHNDRTDYQDKKRSNDRAIGPHCKAYDNRYAHQDEGPSDDVVDVDGDVDGGALCWQEQAKQRLRK